MVHSKEFASIYGEKEGRNKKQDFNNIDLIETEELKQEWILTIIRKTHVDFRTYPISLKECHETHYPPNLA